MKKFKQEQIAKKVVDFCLEKYKFIFICGNGGSGKTTLSKKLVEEINLRGLEANCIDMDDFMLDSKVRRENQKEWVDVKGNKRVSYHTWAFKESYHLDLLEGIIHSVEQGIDSCYKIKHSDKLKKVRSALPITIIEGVGTAFLYKKETAYGIFIMCEFEDEIDRRINRARDGESDLPREEIKKKAIERNEQFEVTILPNKNNFDLELWSLKDHSFKIERDNFNVLQNY